MLKRHPSIDQFLREECYTTEQEKDPRKPLLVINGLVRQNLDFDPDLVAREYAEKEARRRRDNSGTSFFLNFDPACHIHQQDDYTNDEIAKLANDRFLKVFCSQFPDNQPPARAVDLALETALCHWPQPGFNNGEIYFWLKQLKVTEDFAFQLQRALWESVNQDPIMVSFEGQEHEVWFYGSGFRYY